MVPEIPLKIGNCKNDLAASNWIFNKIVSITGENTAWTTNNINNIKEI